MKPRKKFKTYALEATAAGMVDRLADEYSQSKSEIIRQAVLSFFKKKITLNDKIKKWTHAPRKD